MGADSNGTAVIELRSCSPLQPPSWISGAARGRAALQSSPGTWSCRPWDYLLKYASTPPPTLPASPLTVAFIGYS